MFMLLIALVVSCVTPPGGRSVGGASEEQYCSRHVIQNYINSARKDLHAAYERALKRNERIEGLVELKFLIRENGQVDSLKALESTLNDSLFLQSILDVVGMWEFPVLPGFERTEIVLPFAFEGAQE